MVWLRHLFVFIGVSGECRHGLVCKYREWILYSPYRHKKVFVDVSMNLSLLFQIQIFLEIPFLLCSIFHRSFPVELEIYISLRDRKKVSIWTRNLAFLLSSMYNSLVKFSSVISIKIYTWNNTKRHLFINLKSFFLCPEPRSQLSKL